MDQLLPNGGGFHCSLLPGQLGCGFGTGEDLWYSGCRLRRGVPHHYLFTGVRKKTKTSNWEPRIQNELRQLLE